MDRPRLLSEDPTKGPLEAVRAFLAAYGTPALASTMTGPARQWAELLERVAERYTVDTALTTHRLELRESRDSYAVCDCEASAILTLRGTGIETARFERRVSGPVVVAATPEGWKVVDWVADGRRALESLRLYDPVRGYRSRLVEIVPLAMQLTESGTVVVVDVTNVAPVPLEVRNASVERPAALKHGYVGGYLNGRTKLGPGESARISIEFGGAALPLHATAATARLWLAFAGRRRVLMVKLGLPFKGAAGRSRARRQLPFRQARRLRWALNLVLTAVFVWVFEFPSSVPFFGHSSPTSSPKAVATAFVTAARKNDFQTLAALSAPGRVDSMMILAAYVGGGAGMKGVQLSSDPTTLGSTVGFTFTFSGHPTCPPKVRVSVVAVKVANRWLVSNIEVGDSPGNSLLCLFAPTRPSKR